MPREAIVYVLCLFIAGAGGALVGWSAAGSADEAPRPAERVTVGGLAADRGGDRFEVIPAGCTTPLGRSEPAAAE